MDQLPIILVAAAVAAMAWAVCFAVANFSASSKRKLQQRLGSQLRSDSVSSQGQSVRLRDQQDPLAGQLGRWTPVKVIRRRLAQVYPSASLTKFLIFSLSFAVSAGLIAWGITQNVMVVAAATVAGGYLPFWVVSFKRSGWHKRVTHQLPEALDFLCRVLRAGQSMSTGLQMMSDELGEPLAGEFRRCYEQHGLGHPLEDCLRDMAVRIESQDFAFFVTAVIIQRQSGGDMAEILHNISNMIRQRLRLHQSVKAKTAEGRFTGYIMLAFPLVMFVLSYVLNPERGGLLLHTGEGHLLLGIASGLMCLGFFLIRKITTVRV